MVGWLSPGLHATRVIRVPAVLQGSVFIGVPSLRPPDSGALSCRRPRNTSAQKLLHQDASYCCIARDVCPGRWLSHCLPQCLRPWRFGLWAALWAEPDSSLFLAGLLCCWSGVAHRRMVLGRRWEPWSRQLHRLTLWILKSINKWVLRWGCAGVGSARCRRQLECRAAHCRWAAAGEGRTRHCSPAVPGPCKARAGMIFPSVWVPWSGYVSLLLVSSCLSRC